MVVCSVDEKADLLVVVRAVRKVVELVVEKAGLLVDELVYSMDAKKVVVTVEMKAHLLAVVMAVMSVVVMDDWLVDE